VLICYEETSYTLINCVFAHYEDTKGNAKCRNCGGFWRFGSCRVIGNMILQPIRFPVQLLCKLCTILYHFQVIASYLSKFAILTYRTCTGWLKIKYLTRQYAISLQPVVLKLFNPDTSLNPVVYNVSTPHLNYTTTLLRKTITMKITIFHRGFSLVTPR